MSNVIRFTRLPLIEVQELNPADKVIALDRYMTKHKAHISFIAGRWGVDADDLLYEMARVYQHGYRDGSGK